MAYVKVLRGRNIFDLNKYILLGRDQSDPILNNKCFGENVADQMYLSQLMVGKRDMDAIHIVQSFDNKDSKKLSPDEYTKIGHDMVLKMFPEHEFIVVTHTDTEQTHNHIMLNPCHPESGRKIPNKKRLLYDLRDLSDKISNERGLSIIESQSVLNWESMTEKVRAINKRGGFSWVIDLQEKCDFAKSIATSFDEYAGILNQFSIEVRVENKNIQYIYPGRRSKRGGTKGLGENYTKNGLIDKFRQNYEEFYQKGFKKKSIDEIDFNDHWKFHRGNEKYIVPEYRYKDLIVPLELFKKASAINLKEYCEKTGIEFSKSGDEFSLLEKPNIVFDKHTWKNIDKKTSGTSLEFISYLKNTGFLDTLRELDDSGKIKQLQSSLEIKKPSFQAFFIKSEVKSTEFDSQRKLMSDLGFSGRALSGLLRQSRVKAYKNGNVKVFSQNNNKLSLTFYNIVDDWSCHKSSGLNHLFYQSINKKNKKTLIFSNPIDFLSSNKFLDLCELNNFPFNILVPMTPVNLFLNENQKSLEELKNVFVVHPKVPVIWGSQRKVEKNAEDLLKTLFERNIGYKTIDDLLKDILVRSREL